MIATSAETLLLRVFSFFGTPAYVAPELAFWDWFASHECRLFALNSEDDPLFGELADMLEAVDADLSFELGCVANGQREFVISASGVPAAFPAVERLFRTAPVLACWQWVKFRPSRLPLHAIEFESKSVRVEDVRYALVRDETRVGIILFMGNYCDEDCVLFARLGRLLLDEALGEYAVARYLGFVEIQSHRSRYFPHASPIRELPAAFEEFRACHV